MMLFDLNFLWYTVIGLAMTLYAVLDGFDLGVGAIHLICARTDEQRRIFLNAIGPVWDGNEVWIVVVLGGLLAGFSQVYTTILSGFYGLIMVLIAAMMLRPVAIEFRSKRTSPFWRLFWDTTFCLSSTIIAFILGLILGNLLIGVPLDNHFEYQGTILDLFNLYSVAVALFVVFTFSLHGALFVTMKTEGDFHLQMSINSAKLFCCFALYFFAIITATIFTIPRVLVTLQTYKFLAIIPLMTVFNIYCTIRCMSKSFWGLAFISSCATILFLSLSFGLSMFPYIIYSSVDPVNNSLTLYNSAAESVTLKVLLTVVALALPLSRDVWIMGILSFSWEGGY